MNTSIIKSSALNSLVSSLLRKGFESRKVARRVARKIQGSKGKYNSSHFVKTGDRAGLLKKKTKKAQMAQQVRKRKSPSSSRKSSSSSVHPKVVQQQPKVVQQQPKVVQQQPKVVFMAILN